tara:strand:+ start:156 stop:1001 length:846 start_codon:yes stop_codon:yes gene_type:complete
VEALQNRGDTKRRAKRSGSDVEIASPTAGCWLWTLALVVLLSLPAVGQVNIETVRSRADSVGTKGVLEFGLTFRTGNVDLFEFGPSFRLDRLSARSRQLVILNGDLGWEGGERFTNSALGHLRHEIRTGHARFAPEAYAQLNYDLSRRLKMRMLGGLGVRVGFRRPGIRQFFGLSYMFEHERNDLVPGDLHRRTTSTHRTSVYVSILTRESADFTYAGVIYLQPRLPNFDDLRILITSRVGVAVTERVDVVTTMRFRFDARPPVDVGRTDFRLISGLSIDF